MPIYRDSYLKRLPREYYCGNAWVHWTSAIYGRRTGWLDPVFYYRFRETLAHIGFRHKIACPIFCLMPDHFHMLWCGVSDDADQLLAMKGFRRDINHCLKHKGHELQKQSYDTVLLDEELERTAIEDTIEYIARNPERKRLTTPDRFADYAFTGCLMPGFPSIKLFQEPGWDLIWRVLDKLKQTECFAKSAVSESQKMP